MRNGSQTKWFVDGKDYMSAVADAIESATKEILITDWQMNPHIFMKRPDTGAVSLKWRLDEMLLKKADNNVSVYILLYYETQFAMDLGSKYSMAVLNNHSNIEVHRHPDMLSGATQPSTMFRWSHHEKVVIVDRNIAFVGEIDLCFGRWDTHSHELMDDYPVRPCAKQNVECVQDSQESRYSRWIGKDYRNTFFNNESKTNWERPFDDYEYVNRKEIPRMPWHDVACAFTGAAVLDAVKHFIQRYNALKPWWKFWKFPDSPMEVTSDYNFTDSSVYSNVNVQVLRSVDDWSAGQPHEASIYNAYLRVIKNAEHYVYIENQFFISSQPGILMSVKNQIQSALADRIYCAYQENEDFRVMIVMPLKPEFGPEQWNQDSGNGLTALSYWNYATIYSGENSLFNKLKERKMPAQAIKSYFSLYGLRTHGSLNGNLVTEIIYVHSKVMIVDDRLAIIGSANINDRSMLGGRDSEIAVMVEDVDMIDGKMNDVSYQVGKFAHTLRCHLMEEHLGLLSTENELSGLKVEDPLVYSFYTGISKQATDNMLIYEQVFRSKILPTNQVWNYEDLENWKTFQGFADIDQNLAEEELRKIQGNIVKFPPLFLIEVLRPSYLDYFNMYVDSRGIMTNTNLDGENPTYFA